MKTIVFDVDGTMFDTKNGIVNCLNEVLKNFGYQAIEEKDENKYIGPAIKDSLMNFNEFSEQKAIEATKMYRERYVDSYVCESEPYRGLMELLEYLKKKDYKICIATMKTRSQVDKILEKYGLYGYFEMIETALVNGGYTKYDMLLKIKGECMCDDIYFVGDTNSDYQASKKAGIPFIYAKYGYGEIDEKDYYIINVLEELKRFV